MNNKLIQQNLSAVYQEVCKQADIAINVPSSQMPFDMQMDQIREWIEDVGEYGIAYESLVSLLELYPIQLSGSAAVKLLEVSLLFGFKTERAQDRPFDRRETKRI